MSKVDQEFKQHVNQEFAEGDYVGKKVFHRVIAVILVMVVLAGIGGIGYTLTIGKWQTNAEREVFKNTTAYTEAAAQFLADSYKEYQEADTDTAKKAVMEYVIMRYPNLDTSAIDNSTLKQFYNKCLNGGN